MTVTGGSPPQGLSGPSGTRGLRYPTLADAAKAQSLNDVLDMLNRGYPADDRDDEGCTAMHWAAWFKLDSLVPRLLERRASVDPQNQTEETPIHWAAKSGNLYALDLLTKGDRSLLSIRDIDGFSAFILAAQHDNPALMEWMYLKGVSVEEQDNWGRTAMHWTAYKGHRRSVQWLLSRSANILQRDHEGTTILHWAALKGQNQVAEMLLDIGAVHMIDAVDHSGETPYTLAMRKGNRYLIAIFLKAQAFQFLFGRPNINRNNFANLFAGFSAFNVLVFGFVVAPGIAEYHPLIVLSWAGLMSLTLLLWVQNVYADPGWIRPKTIHSQEPICLPEHVQCYDPYNPVESQMAHSNDVQTELAQKLESSASPRASSTMALAVMEMEQSKLCYQRHLIRQAKEKITEAMQRAAYAEGHYGGLAAGTGETELQPLMDGQYLTNLERAAAELREREVAKSEEVGRARVERLLGDGGGQYLTLLEKGDFKQICVICRATRRMRSHHCKECGRCVDRLDHHCPWIDNCVGLGNQRAFYCFIFLLMLVILLFYWTVLLFFCDEVFPAMMQATFFGFISSLANGAIGAEVRTLVVMAASMFNLVWLAFVGALVARHTAYMAVNVTTFEVLTRPAHVVRRFPKSKNRFWFLNNFSVLQSFSRILGYWTLDTSRDAADFLVPAGAGESFVVPGSQEPGSGAMASFGSNRGGPTADGKGESPAYHLVSRGTDMPV